MQSDVIQLLDDNSLRDWRQSSSRCKYRQKNSVFLSRKNCQRPNGGFIFSCSPANLVQSTTPAFKFYSPTSAFLDLCHLSAKQWVSNAYTLPCNCSRRLTETLPPFPHLSHSPSSKMKSCSIAPVGKCLPQRLQPSKCFAVLHSWYFHPLLLFEGRVWMWKNSKWGPFIVIRKSCLH